MSILTELRRMNELAGTLNEGKVERAAVDFLSQQIKQSKFKGKVFIAGGYVRDEFLGLDPKDIDLVVEMPDGGIKFAEWLTKKLKIYKSGSNPVVFKKFGTAKFNLLGITHAGQDLSGLDIEVVMTRTEKYDSKSRKPEVATGTLKDDVERRDFTVNSLLKDLTTGEVLDLTGMGKNDIKKGVVRTPLDPDIIFTDDPLRMLRAIRFAVKYNWDLPFFMIRSMKKNSIKLKKISAERIRDELNKMLVTKNPDKAIRLLQITNLNKHVMPELDLLKGLGQNKHHDMDVLGHSLKVLKGVPAKLTTRLAALMHDVGKSQTKEVIDGEVHFYKHEEVSGEMARIIMTRLKYPNNIIEPVVKAVDQHMRLKSAGDDANITDKALRKLSRQLGDHLEDTLDLMHSDNLAHATTSVMPNQIPNIRKRLKGLKALTKENPKLPVNGGDVMKHVGLNKGGPIVGKLLALVQDAWDDNPKLSRDDALNLVALGYKELTKG